MPRLWYHGEDFYRWIADKISAQKKESGAKFPLLTKKQLIHVEKKKNKLQWSVTKYIKHTPEQTIYLEIFGQHKRLSMFVCVCAFYFDLVWYLFIFFLYCCFSEKSCCWVGMDIKIVWKDLEKWKEYDLLNLLQFLLKLVHVDFLSLNNIYLIVYNNFVIYLLI